MLRRKVAGLLLRAARWKTVGEVPDRGVLVGAPHTSNWDWVLTILLAWTYGINIRLLVKQELFVGPLGWLLRRTGAVELDRKNPGGTIKQLLAESDVVSLHLRLSDRTRGLVGAAELAAMKPTAVLVNTSRSALVDQVTEDVVARQFAHRRPSRVARYLCPTLHAMNFVLDDVLDGGVNDALNLDSHGKALSFLLLELPIRLPHALCGHLVGPG